MKTVAAMQENAPAERARSALSSGFLGSENTWLYLTGTVAA